MLWFHGSSKTLANEWLWIPRKHWELDPDYNFITLNFILRSLSNFYSWHFFSRPHVAHKYRQHHLRCTVSWYQSISARSKRIVQDGFPHFSIKSCHQIPIGHLSKTETKNKQIKHHWGLGAWLPLALIGVLSFLPVSCFLISPQHRCPCLKCLWFDVYKPQCDNSSPWPKLPLTSFYSAIFSATSLSKDKLISSFLCTTYGISRDLVSSGGGCLLPLIKMTGNTHSQKWNKKKGKEGLPKLEEMWGSCEMLKMLH